MYVVTWGTDGPVNPSEGSESDSGSGKETDHVIRTGAKVK